MTDLHAAIMNLEPRESYEAAAESYRLGFRDARHAAAELVSAALSAPAGWQPIETAPKDGTSIILGRAPDADYETGFVGEGFWMEGDDDGPDNMGHDAGFMDCTYDFFRCSRSFGAEKYRSAGLQPTHWMPLPQLPAAPSPQEPK